MRGLHYVGLQYVGAKSFIFNCLERNAYRDEWILIKPVLCVTSNEHPYLPGWWWRIYEMTHVLDWIRVSFPQTRMHRIILSLYPWRVLLEKIYFTVSVSALQCWPRRRWCLIISSLCAAPDLGLGSLERIGRAGLLWWFKIRRNFRYLIFYIFSLSHC